MLIIEPYWNWNKQVDLELLTLRKLIIEPYWNWNRVKASVNRATRFLIIEPYWNWNFLTLNTKPFLIPPNNRTILELKLFIYWNLTYHYSTNNRTILELKSRYNFSNEKDYYLIIEPYWNWNRDKVAPEPGLNKTNNRTILELKFPIHLNKACISSF